MTAQPLETPLETAPKSPKTDRKRVSADSLPDEPIAHPQRWFLVCKGCVDRLLALGLLALCTPVIAVAAVLVKLTSHGPAFYLQTRVGKDGRQFTLYKLRTMVDDAEALTGPVWADDGDPRVTPLGRFLRDTHVDELPQFVNVLLGHMSLVGPRPERPEIAAKLQWHFEQYTDRQSIHPGIAGLAQLRLPPDSTLESVRRKLLYDLYYVQFADPWLDTRIFLVTCFRLVGDVFRACGDLIGVPHLPEAGDRAAIADPEESEDWASPEDPSDLAEPGQCPLDRCGPQPECDRSV